MRMQKEFMKGMYEGGNEGRGVRGKPPGKWIIVVSEHWGRRDTSSWTECGERERARTGRDGDTFATANPGGKFPQWDRKSEIWMDKYVNTKSKATFCCPIFSNP